MPMLLLLYPSVPGKTQVPFDGLPSFLAISFRLVKVQRSLRPGNLEKDAFTTSLQSEVVQSRRTRSAHASAERLPCHDM